MLASANMTDITNNAVEMLIAERDRLDQAIQLLQGGASAPRAGRPKAAKAAKAAKKTGKRLGRPPLSDEARKAQSEKMKAYWAARKKKAAKKG